MKEKIVLITGANSGVGFGTAKALAGLGAALVMVCRSEERGAAALREIGKVAAGPDPVLMMPTCPCKLRSGRLQNKCAHAFRDSMS